MMKAEEVAIELQKQIRETEAQLRKLEKAVRMHTVLLQRLGALRESYALFMVKSGKAPMEAALELGPPQITQRRPAVSPKILAVLQEMKKPAYVNDIVAKVQEKGVTATRATIVSIMARYVKEGILERPEPGFYAMRKEFRD